MLNNGDIAAVVEKGAEKLCNSLVFCQYCRTPFKEYDTIIPGKGIVPGEVGVVEYKKHF